MTTTPDIAELARQLPLARGVRIAAVAGGLLALEKPAGMLTHPNNDGRGGATLLDADFDHRIEGYRWETSKTTAPSRLFLLNRLDSPTSGLVLAALDRESAQQGAKAFVEQRVEKIYMAIVVGKPRPSSGVWRDRLMRERPRGAGGPIRVHARGGQGSQAASCRYTDVDTRFKRGMMATLVRLEPLTGRTHQLRVQSASHRHPILGDGTYGDFMFNRAFAQGTGIKRMFLHALSLSIPDLGFKAESPLPKEFAAALDFVGLG